MIRLLIALCATGLVSCSSTYKVRTTYGALGDYTSFEVKHEPEYSGDATLKAAVRHELQDRIGLGKPGKNLEVIVADHWAWDIVMYLHQCEFTFRDADSQAIMATGFYRNSLFHTYPSSKKVVKRVFVELDQKGAFRK